MSDAGPSKKSIELCPYTCNNETDYLSVYTKFSHFHDQYERK